MNKARKLFEEEIQAFTECSAEEMQSLLQKDKDDSEAVNRFLEGNLHRVLRIAGEFESEPVDFMDLIQEGSLAVLDFFRKEEAWTEDTSESLDQCIRSQIRVFTDEEKQSLETAKELASKLNMLDFLTTKIAEKTGREATIEELSKAMDLPEDEIDYLLRVALSAVNKED
jgi:RNA polymerase primary sigma factor